MQLATYDGLQYEDDNMVRDLLLIDPRYSGERRFVQFQRVKDNFAEIEGIASIGIVVRND